MIRYIGDSEGCRNLFPHRVSQECQFNREYRRFFGQPPIRDIKALRDGKVVTITTA